MSGLLNDDGQPPKRYYQSRVADRQIHEMLGLVKGVVCDGVLNDAEIGAFRNWLRANPDATVRWPGRDLARRIVEIFGDGRVDAAERGELYELFCDTVGDGGEESLRENFSGQLPFDDPPPTIVFDGNLFCFTGAFAFGTRVRCEQAVVDRGGRCHKSIVKKPMTVVVGVIGSEAWIQSPFGRKIEKAVQYRSEGVPVRLVSEAHWAEAISIDA